MNLRSFSQDIARTIIKEREFSNPEISTRHRPLQGEVRFGSKISDDF